MPEYLNVTDDTGMDIVHALRRLCEARGGPAAVIEPVNRRDNAFNLLDRTGRKIVSAIEALETVPGAQVPLAAPGRSGLMSGTDKEKLDALTMAGVMLADSLPDTAAPGQMALCPEGLFVYSGESWHFLEAERLPEEEIGGMLRDAGLE